MGKASTLTRSPSPEGEEEGGMKDKDGSSEEEEDVKNEIRRAEEEKDGRS